MGYIDAFGMYHRGKPDISKLQNHSQSTWKQWEHNRQRKDFAKEIIQPFTREGKPNSDFIAAYPEESKDYGFIPHDNDLLDKEAPNGSN